MRSRLLVLAQFIVVYLYAKFGYFDTVNSADWARFFYVSNQLIMCAWIYMLIKNNFDRSYLKTALTFNLLLAVLWAHHYITVFNEYIETYGIVEAVLCFMIIAMFIDLFLNFGNKNA